MSGKNSLLEFLRQQKAEQEAEGKIDWNVRRREWLDAIDSLFKAVEDWLRGAVSQHLLRIDRTVTNISEEHIGTYEVPVLRITAPRGRHVDVIPRARNVFGGSGRVDLESGPKSITLIRTAKKTWAFTVRHANSLQKVELTEESLAEFLRDLLG